MIATIIFEVFLILLGLSAVLPFAHELFFRDYTYKDDVTTIWSSWRFIKVIYSNETGDVAYLIGRHLQLYVASFLGHFFENKVTLIGYSFVDYGEPSKRCLSLDFLNLSLLIKFKTRKST